MCIYSIVNNATKPSVQGLQKAEITARIFTAAGNDLKFLKQFKQAASLMVLTADISTK